MFQPLLNTSYKEKHTLFLKLSKVKIIDINWYFENSGKKAEFFFFVIIEIIMIPWRFVFFTYSIIFIR